MSEAVGQPLIIRLIIQTILLDPPGAVWTDAAPDVSSLDPSGAVQIDAEHPSRNRLLAAQGRGSPHGSPPGVTRWNIWRWLDSTPDLSSANSSQVHAVDAEDQPTDLAGGVRT